MNQVILTPQAQKDLKKIPTKKRLKIKKKAELLKDNLHGGKKLSGDLKNYYSLKIWPYRIIYQIIKKKVWIIHVQHRQGVYK
ncbi:hypothetical protein COT75_03760 [Candidatus Beckwithbacteria bacterium CG10_big_fil_rev_8_21_14_0_10_34_10]|uniref:Type II toxin-antitoxin system mRNA interferase toxin, RelE/StbE family n=1 Tax=Candidatus Beckwithbacteria bacterium CG10_big_fil_rev_8_21_14_0_10_34_10 TaxID=1974495 RepID=A0A2H0W8G7_9BACT|nr:MAG: hypothetical protein COT75_03760 [Candidatus Beckwithbacteria bacterium CG10_big_fil_rev_8_21_14_0_10_34_10]